MLVETVEYFWGFKCADGSQYTQYSNVSPYSDIVSGCGGVISFCATPKIYGYPTVMLDVDNNMKRLFLFRLLSFGKYEDALYFKTKEEYAKYHKDRMFSYWCLGVSTDNNSNVAIIDTRQRYVWFKKLSGNPEIELLRAPWQL